MKIERDYYRREWVIRISPDDIRKAEYEAKGDYKKYYDILFNQVMEAMANA